MGNGCADEAARHVRIRLLERGKARTHPGARSVRQEAALRGEDAAGRLRVRLRAAAIAAFPGIDRGFDWDSLPDYLVHRYVPGPNTFFRSIKKLGPGHVATWRNGTLEVHRYYTPPYANAKTERIDMDEAVRRFTQTLKESVHLRLRSDAPFGAFLSGGIELGHHRGPDVGGNVAAGFDLLGGLRRERAFRTRLCADRREALQDRPRRDRRALERGIRSPRGGRLAPRRAGFRTVGHPDPPAAPDVLRTA